MSLWSDFNASSEDQWIKKVLDDSINKTIQDFHWETEYGTINTFRKSLSTLKTDKNDKLSEIAWNFTEEKKINSQILNRLKDGINSIHINSINYADSIFKNVMNEIINNHVLLSHNASSEEISSWTDWINSNPNLKGSFRMCLLIGSHLNEIIEIHKKNNIEIPKQIIIKSLLDNSFLENISKIKAIKSVINQVLKIHNIKAKVLIETCVNSQILKNQSEDFRILTITSTAMSSFIGGANSFILSDLLLLSKGDYWKKIAANIPLILNEESQINIFNDVTKGAHVIEQISFKMASKAWRLLKKIEENGGLLNNFKNSNLSEFIKN